jgi:hypothetical protein
MKGILSFALVTLGTVIGAMAVARTDPAAEGWIGTWQVSGLWLVVAVVAIGAGIVLRRSALREEAEAPSPEGEGYDVLVRTIDAATKDVAEIETSLEKLQLEDLHARVDAVLSGPLTDFAAARQELSDRHGMAVYAKVLGPFSQGERFLNRAWSASTDGYLDEARDSVRAARPELEAARAALAEADRA